MKNKFLLLAVVCCCSWAGCKKSFLEQTPASSVTLENYYNTAAEVNGSTGVLYNSVWLEWYDKAFTSVGDILGGTVTGTNGNTQYNSFWNFNIISTDDLIKATWKSCYKAAGNASVLIQNFSQKKATVGDGAYLDLGIAEAKFIRAFCYFYIGRTFGDAPIVDNPLDMTKEGGSLVPKYLQKDVLRFAIEDLKVAEVGLPDAPYQPGRVTKNSAKALMAKIYLYLKDYANAKIKAQEVMDFAAANPNILGLTDFQQMFTSTASNNNKESLFALQWAFDLGWNGGNRWMSYAAPQPLTKPGPTNGNGYSSIIPSIDVLDPTTGWANNDRRRGWSVMEHGFHRADWVNDNFPTGFTYDTVTIQTTDFKVLTGTRSNILKYVVGPNRTAEPVNGGGGTSSSICTYLLRYADVLLIYAEATLAGGGSTSDPAAIAAFNAVHQRAGMLPVSAITMDDILRERKCEFAFEGDYWFDMQRQAFNADMQPVNIAKTKQLVEAQERGVYDGNKVLNSQKVQGFTVDKLFLPIPLDETVADPKLLEAAIPYY
ncbi:MAG TPA: RagB/SusD family nutrient uptake outer membrane protein [Ferruginibacter sp.]|nr:RagB/SusD family nutrient uptake outer membrane protein [Ferruginibacter sp.]HPH91486.1 RagB/SusD family nutrient uptake outer membrane protein [Ferruginibacter sp.]